MYIYICQFDEGLWTLTVPKMKKRRDGSEKGRRVMDDVEMVVVILLKEKRW